MKKMNPSSLIKFNSAMAVLHATQAALIALLSVEFLLPITTSFLSFDFATQQLISSSEQLFEISLPLLIVLFLLLSALAHAIIVTVYRKRYIDEIKQGINRARWIEYSLSASIMMVAISLLVGIYDLSSLIMIFGLVAVMNLLGLVMEIHNQTTKKVGWISFIVGCIAGIIPWIVVGLYFWSSAAYGTGDIPSFVYWIYVSIFIFFNCFALNMFLQYKKIGPWRNYLFGEVAYVALSLVAKSALAWQVFAGTLRP